MRVGRFSFRPESRPYDKATGDRAVVSGIYFYPERAWEERDPKTGFVDYGPETFDTENLNPGNQAAVEDFFGEGWEKKFEKWIKDNQGRYRFVEGAPKRTLKVSVDADDFAEFKAFKAAGGKVESKGGGATGMKFKQMSPGGDKT